MYLNLRYQKKKLEGYLFLCCWFFQASATLFTDFNKSSYYSFQMVSLFYLCVCMHMGFLKLADGFSSPQRYG